MVFRFRTSIVMIRITIVAEDWSSLFLKTELLAQGCSRMVVFSQYNTFPRMTERTLSLQNAWMNTWLIVILMMCILKLSGRSFRLLTTWILAPCVFFPHLMFVFRRFLLMNHYLSCKMTFKGICLFVFFHFFRICVLNRSIADASFPLMLIPAREVQSYWSASLCILSPTRDEYKADQNRVQRDTPWSTDFTELI